MKLVSHFTCIGCGVQYAKTSLMNLCPVDHRPLQIDLNISAVKAAYPDLSWYRPDLKSMWRFGAMLALNSCDTNDERHILSLGEGYTPEIPLSQFQLARQHGFELFLKDEGQPHAGFGANPTASFKDRGMSMAISMARHFGVTKVVVPTQGNAGDSLAEYALHAGMQCVVIMPDDTPMPILGRVSALAKLSPVIDVELVKGTIKEAGELMKQKYLPQGYFNMATFQEPGWRIEGKKTLGYELTEPRSLDKQIWQLPDVILYPTGGGTGILGMWKAFDELQALGLIDERRPKMIAVQSEATRPIVDAFQHNDLDSNPAIAGKTLATGLNVPGGIGHFKVLEIIRQSGGMAISVDENSIAQNLKAIYQDYRIWICPEGAATLAAIPKAIEHNLIRPRDKVVAFNTGSFEKYLPNVRHLVFLLKI
jgi:threonine synthase